MKTTHKFACAIATVMLFGFGTNGFSQHQFQINSGRVPYGYYNNYGGFGGWNRAVTELGDYMRGLGQLRLDSARAAYMYAKAAQEWPKAYAIARTVKTLEADLVRLENELRSLERQTGYIESYAKTLNSFVIGRSNGTTTTAVDYLLKFLPTEELNRMLDEVAIPEIPTSQLSLVVAVRDVTDPATGVRSLEPIVLEGFLGGNVLEFIDWLSQYNLKVKKGSQAHRALLNLRSILAQAGENWAASLEEKIIALEDRKLDIWGPVYSGEFGLPARQNPE